MTKRLSPDAAYSASFETVTRSGFRKYFQPSRIVLGIVPGPTRSQVNLITLCFMMHSAYKPPMMAFSVQRTKFSYELFVNTDYCVLGVPGESIAAEVLLCGIESGRDVDKVSACGFTLIHSQTVDVPSIRECIANIELEIIKRVEVGDHMTVFGKARRYAVNRGNEDRCLLSIGPETDGYKVLVRKGTHRIGVVDSRR